VLSGLSFRNAQLKSANFYGAQLVSALFNNADVSFASFENTHLEGADFTGAKMDGTVLTNAAVAVRGSFQSYTDQVLVYNGSLWTCQPSSSQKWCGKPYGTWSYTEQNGIPYTVTFTETLLAAASTTTCPDASRGDSAGSDSCRSLVAVTPVKPLFPTVPACVPSATNWCP
jgi:hypothetical protein